MKRIANKSLDGKKFLDTKGMTWALGITAIKSVCSVDKKLGDKLIQIFPWKIAMI